jgi:hypothetical protein
MQPCNLAWKLNWYRQSELEGALLLGRLVRQADDPELIARLTKHCADEARHAWLWARTLERLHLPMLPIRRSYQSFYSELSAAPGSMAETLALTHVFEQRVDSQFRKDLADQALEPLLRHSYEIMIADERQHLDWIHDWLLNIENGRALIDRYREIDCRVYEQLRPYDGCIADIPGLSIKSPLSVVGVLPSSTNHKDTFHAAH